MYDIYLNTGIKLPFPIIADRNGTIARKYGMISNNVSNSETVRNVVIIDPEGKIRAILIYPMEIGRFIPEILRIVEAFKCAEANDALSPANWLPGGNMLQRIPKTFTALEERLDEIEKNQNGLTWYLSYKQ